MPDTSNGRVTLAVLKRDVEAVHEDISAILRKLDKVQSDVSAVKIAGVSQHERITTNKSEIDKLRDRSDKVDTVNFISTVVGSVLGVFFGRQ